LLFLNYFCRNTPICCGTGIVFINAYYLGKEHFTIEKLMKFEWTGDLINRLIHRSWGEGVVTISLDLSLHIFHCSRIYGSVAGATSLVRRPLRHSLSHLKDSLQPFEQADGLVRGD
jgi:hypothetical protein